LESLGADPLLKRRGDNPHSIPSGGGYLIAENKSDAGGITLEEGYLIAENKSDAGGWGMYPLKIKKFN
jgi:hypothetical protein